jgi:hypothetical protein
MQIPKVTHKEYFFFGDLNHSTNRIIRSLVLQDTRETSVCILWCMGGACLDHIRSIKVVSRRLPQNSLSVQLGKSHTEESLRRHRSGRYCQVLSSHSGQVRKLLLVLLPPHQRVCVVGHLLHFHLDLRLDFPFERGRVEIHGCGTNT